MSVFKPPGLWSSLLAGGRGLTLQLSDFTPPIREAGSSGDSLRVACAGTARPLSPWGHPPFSTRAGLLFCLQRGQWSKRGTWCRRALSAHKERWLRSPSLGRSRTSPGPRRERDPHFSGRRGLATGEVGLHVHLCRQSASPRPLDLTAPCTLDLTPPYTGSHPPIH